MILIAFWYNNSIFKRQLQEYTKSLSFIKAYMSLPRSILLTKLHPKWTPNYCCLLVLTITSNVHCSLFGKKCLIFPALHIFSCTSVHMDPVFMTQFAITGYSFCYMAASFGRRERGCQWSNKDCASSLAIPLDNMSLNLSTIELEGHKLSTSMRPAFFKKNWSQVRLVLPHIYKMINY